MAEWQEKYPVEYSAASDENIDSWVQKYIAEIARLYELLGRLRRLDGSAVELTDTVAYQLRADYVTNKLLLRDKENKNWIELGLLEEKFGHTPEYLGVVANHGNVPSLQMGIESERPETEEVNAIYIAHDTKKKYRYDNGWNLMNVVIPEDIVTVAAPNKLLRLNDKGKLPADITGSSTHAEEADHAKKADEATHAEEADHAFRADEAVHATNAESAKHASSADEVEHSTTTSRLEIPIKINGVPFDGSRSINIGIAGEGQEAINGYQSLLWRTAQNEREISNITLALEDMQIYPDYNNLLAENFTSSLDDVDMTTVSVTSCAAGDDSINVANLAGLRVGSTYTIADGSKQEYVQIKSVIKNETTLRVILNNPLQNTYSINSTFLYRTTATISNNQAIGTGNSKNYSWYPNEIWQGVNASTEVILSLSNKVNDYIVDGDIGFTADGAFTLI